MYGLNEDPSLESEMKLLLARAGKRHLVWPMITEA